MATNTGAGKVLVVGVALGLASTVLLYVYLRRQSQVYKANWKTVLVANQEIPAKTKITYDMVKTFSTAPQLITPGALEDSQVMQGKLARHTIHQNTQITESDLMTEGEIPGLAIHVPPGKRAIAIAASEVIAVGTMIKPGDHVDVLATYRDPEGKEETTQMILQNTPVLAVNVGQIDPATPEGAKTSMTLAVAPEDSERLTAASQAGVLRVSLRSPNDKDIVHTPGITVRDITVDRWRREEPPVKEEKNSNVVLKVERPIEKPNEITIIRGTDVRSVVP
jgi:pilus assembly protein CpaB